MTGVIAVHTNGAKHHSPLQFIGFGDPWAKNNIRLQNLERDQQPPRSSQGPATAFHWLPALKKHQVSLQITAPKSRSSLPNTDLKVSNILYTTFWQNQRKHNCLVPKPKMFFAIVLSKIQVHSVHCIQANLLHRSPGYGFRSSKNPELVNFDQTDISILDHIVIYHHIFL